MYLLLFSALLYLCYPLLKENVEPEVAALMNPAITAVLDQMDLMTSHRTRINKDILWSKLTSFSARKTQSAISLESEGWESWVSHMFGYKKLVAFSKPQREIWEWHWSLKFGDDPLPCIAILPRGGGKTTTSDMCSAMLLATRRRECILNVAGDQPMANARIKSLGTLVTHSLFERLYPGVSRVLKTSRGTSLGWTHQMIRTASGQAAVGRSLFSNIRGLNQDAGLRVDHTVLDDLDDKQDSKHITSIKETRIASDVLPTEGQEVSSVFAIQNMIKDGGIFHRMYNRKNELLQERVMIGPFPAIEDLRYEFQEVEEEDKGHKYTRRKAFITGGMPLWPEGQGIERCQKMIDKYGIHTFLHENQHELQDFKGALLRMEHFKYNKTDLDLLYGATVAIDPSGGSTECGIGCAAIGPGKQLYALEDATTSADEEWPEVAVMLACQYHGRIIIEMNQGGAASVRLLRSAIKKLLKLKQIKYPPDIIEIWADIIKKERARPVAYLYRSGDIIHWKPLPKLETQWTTWIPGESKWSPDRVDAMVHALTYIGEEHGIQIFHKV